MLDLTLQDIGDGLDPTVRVPREPLGIKPWVIIAEIIHHQEGIGQRRVFKPEDTMQVNARVFHGGACGAGGGDRPEGHVKNSMLMFPEIGVFPQISKGPHFP
jgi:hypothetical protein